VSSPRRSTARERVQRRRAVARYGSWKQFAIATVLLVVLALAAATATLWRRADTTLGAIQQEDPRLRRPTAALDALPSITPRSAPTAQARATAAAISAATPAPAPIATLPEALQKPFNVLLIGVDKRPDPDDGARSDTLILIHLDPRNHWASMLSIPRDSVVSIPNMGQAKVNAAYSYGYSNAEALYGAGTQPDAGGAALAAETLEQFLGVTVDYTVQIDFHGFESLVDTLGGLLLDVPTPVLDGEYPTDDYGYQRVYIPAGLQVMDGRTALIYARTRHSSSDFERSRRQQQVLRAVLTQVRSRGLLENAALLPEWAGVLQDNVRTTMPIRDFAFLNGLAIIARDLDPSHVTQFSINPNDVGVTAESGSDLYWNSDDIALLVQRWQQGP
jgi:LCP family protein required for cell wall assembly